MRHNINIEGAAFRLRPVTEADAAAIIDLRSDPQRSRFLHSISSRVEDQLLWLEKYFQRDHDFYFAVERVRDGRFEGTTSLYDISDGRALFGRWVLRHDSLAAAESVLLSYSVGFEILQLKLIYTLAVSNNDAVLSFHDNSGLRRVKEIKNAFILDHGPADAIEHNVSLEEWPSVKARLTAQAEKVAKLINRQR
ncbi:MAG: GNAT family N-acetyltransferase [Pseudomonadota bacterium]